MFTRSPLTPFQTWALANELTSPDDSKSSDPDHDGLSNLHEFLFSTIPTSSTGSLATAETVGGNLVIRWSERTHGATYQLLQSSNLANNWTIATNAILENVGDSIGNYQPRKATIAVGAGNLFFRIKGEESN